MKKKIIIGAVAFIILFVVADYCELLKCLHIDGAIVKRVRFRFIDSKGNSINNVSIVTYLNNNDLGGRFVHDDRDPSVVYGQVGIGASWKQTIFFRKSNPHNRKINKKELKFVFQCPDYQEQEKTFLVENIKEETLTIILQSKEQADE